MTFKYNIAPWLLAILFCYFDTIVRMFPQFMAEDFMRYFNVSSDVLGLFISAFALSYAWSQIPAGMLLDRFGGLKVIIGSATVVAVGSTIIAFSSCYHMAILGNLIIGIGSAPAFLTFVYICSTHFPLHIATPLTSFSNAIMLFSMACAPTVSLLLLQYYSWQGVHTYFSLIALGMASIGAFIMMLSKKEVMQNPVNPVTLKSITRSITAFFSLNFCLNMLSAAFFL